MIYVISNLIGYAIAQYVVVDFSIFLIVKLQLSLGSICLFMESMYYYKILISSSVCSQSPPKGLDQFL